MNEKFDDLLYAAGLTAQGCWDEMDDYDREAILKFGELVVRKCADHILNSSDRYRREYFATKLLEHFELDD